MRPWKEFKAKFTAYEEEYDLTPKESIKMSMYMYMFGGGCKRLLHKNVGEGPRNRIHVYVELMRKLERRFDWQEFEESPKMKFAVISQRFKESLLEWLHRVQALAFRVQA